MMSKALLKRRELILGLGGAGCLTRPLFRESFAEAAEATFPIRFVVLHLAGGVHFPDDGMEGLGTWTFDKVLKPLAGLRSEITQFLNVNNAAGFEMWTKSNEPHGAAMRALLTGDSSVSSAGVAKWATTDSVDQQIAAKIAGATKFQSLQFGISTKGAEIDQMRLIVKGGSALPPIDSPSMMFSRLFANATPSTPPPPSPMAPTPMMAPSQVDPKARKRSVLDHLKAEVSAIKALAGAGEQQKLEQHLDSLRALEMQLGPPVGGGGAGGAGGGPVPTPVAGVGCAAPSVGAQTDVPTVAKQQYDLLYQSLVCDLTRVATVQNLCSAQSGIAFPYLGVSDNHHDLEHGFNPNIDKVQTFFVQHMADFLNRLKSTPEGAGNMLDNTLVLICSEFGNAGSHNHEIIPFLTVGKGGGKVKPGRDIDYNGAPQNLLLRSLMQVYGIDKPIGDANLNGGKVQPLT